ncbi:hypothetical protein GRF29_96g158403 [Pseudopithomyces chartarum]|uniref:Uncharacterized protein n=1 Tax=Pseudopithomyces chartarum TaxID=1892770 RepID=A0AAN6LWV5_9PLEO|nr:hypothetical protein GRF29_96g158403 [Pseudopithomyces chartarum]
MKLQLLTALLTTLGALAAPIAKAGVEHTDTSNLVLSIIENVSVSALDSDDVIEKVKRVAKPGVDHTDTSDVVSIIAGAPAVDSEEAFNKIKRSLASNNARAVAANPDASFPPISLLVIVAKDDEVETRKAGLNDVIEARATAAEKGSAAIPPIGRPPIVAQDDDQEKREAKLINPYIDDVEKADAHAVLGE